MTVKDAIESKLNVMGAPCNANIGSEECVSGKIEELGWYDGELDVGVRPCFGENLIYVLASRVDIDPFTLRQGI